MQHGFVKQMSLYPWSSFDSVISEKPTKLKRKKIIDIYGSKDNFITYHNQEQNLNDVAAFIIE